MLNFYVILSISRFERVNSLTRVPPHSARYILRRSLSIIALIVSRKSHRRLYTTLRYRTSASRAQADLFMSDLNFLAPRRAVLRPTQRVGRKKNRPVAFFAIRFDGFTMTRFGGQVTKGSRIVGVARHE